MRNYIEEISMKRSTKKFAGMLLSIGLMMPALAPAEQKIPQGTKVLWSANEVKWETMPGLAGATQARLWGDPAKSEHGILYKWKAGTDVPVHTHTNGEHGVIIAGTLTLAVEGAPPKEFSPGSYFSMAGGTKHATTCKAGTDCVFFIHREGPFDANMIQITGAAK
jgi:quercetin dioxygenase-like cupin family protein